MAIVASNQISIVDVTDGAEGKGVSSVTPEYYLSSSKTTQTGGSWSTTPPTWSSGKYLWVRHIVTYTDSSVSRTQPYCDTSWEAVKEIEIGSRNLLLNTKTFTEASSTSLSGSFLSGISLSEDKYRDLAVRGSTVTASVTEICRYNFTDFNLGDTFTFSFYAKGDVSDLRVFFYGATGYVQVANGVNSQGATSTNADGRLSFNITSDWQRYWVTWTLKTTGDISIPKYVMLRTNDATSGQTVYVCGCKLETGNKATDWNPAPEDVDAKTNEAAKTATNFMKFNNSVLVIGDMTANTLGNNVLIDSDSVVIRNGNTIRASYGNTTTIGNTTGKHILIDADSVDIKNGNTILSQFTNDDIYLGKNSRSSTIDLCNGTGRIYNSTENNSYLEVSVLTIESDDIVKLTTGHGILSKSTYRSDSWRAEAIIEVGATNPSFWDTGTLGSNLSPYGNITLVAKNSYISDARKRKESCLSLSEDRAYISVRGLSVHMDPGYSCGIWLDGSSSTSTISISADETTISGKLIGVCQEVTQGSLIPSAGKTVTATVGHKTGRTKVLIEMWTTGSSGYYNSAYYENISSSMTAVTVKTLTKIDQSVGRYSISNKGVITLYNVTPDSATSAGEVYYRVTHFN